jgi:hypothetical protein
MDEVFLTELGQSQLTEATLDFEDNDLRDFGFYEGECQGCDIFQSLNDLVSFKRYGFMKLPIQSEYQSSL